MNLVFKQMNKTKRLVLLPVFVGTTFFGMAAAAASLSEVKSDYVSALQAYQVIKKDFGMAKRQYQQSTNKEFNEEMFVKSRDFLLNGDRTLLAYLQWMEVKVNGTESLEQGVRSDMLLRIASNREWLMTQQPIIEQTTKKGELVDVARTFGRYWDEHDHQYKRYNGYLMHAKIVPVLDDAKATSVELAETVTVLKENGKETEDVEALLAEYDGLVAAAETQVTEAKTIYDGLGGSAEEVNAGVKGANQSLRSAYNALGSAEETLVKIMDLLKNY